MARKRLRRIRKANSDVTSLTARHQEPVAPLAAVDVTAAVSSAAATRLLQSMLSQPITGSGWTQPWGPFSLGYDVQLSTSGGALEFVEFSGKGIARLSDLVVNGQIIGYVRIDLNAILPRICVPPFRACVDFPFIGEICTPQVCVSWPVITIPVLLPIPYINFSVDFGLSVRSEGSDWVLVMDLYTYPPYIDFSNLIDKILSDARVHVHRALSSIPLIGDILADLIVMVINALNNIIHVMLGTLKEIVRTLMLALDLFSPTVPIKLRKFPKTLTLLKSAGVDEPDVNLVLQNVTPVVRDKELVLEAEFD